MPPLTAPLMLSITADLQPTPDPRTAHQIGRGIAQLAGRTGGTAVLAGTSTHADSPIVTWRLGIDAGHQGTSDFQTIGHLAESVEQFTGAAIAGWNEDTRIRVVELQISTADQIKRRLAQPTIPDLIGVDEFVELLGVNRSRFYQLRDKPDPGFPAQVGRGVYLRTMAEKYVEERNSRLGREAATEG